MIFRSEQLSRVRRLFGIKLLFHLLWLLPPRRHRPPGFTSQVALAIVIGHGVAPLDITKGVRILIEGQAGKRVGHIIDNVFTEIIETCTDDSQATGDDLGAGQDCKIDSSYDLVIWTKHFTKFITYTLSRNPPLVSQNQLLGGGGLPAELSNPPKAPVGGFSLLINDGLKDATSSSVTLNLKSGSDTVRMAISNSPDFKESEQENYTTNKIWNLCWKNYILQTPLLCPAGIYTVYAKYYTSRGVASGLISDTINFKILNQTSQNQVNSASDYSNQRFYKYLKFGQISTDIKSLQILLNQDADTKVASFGPGSPGKETNFFGILTKAAVIKFQEKYAKDILIPFNLAEGTGFVGKNTLLKINEIFNKVK